MTAASTLRAAIALYATTLIACDGILGLRDIVSDGEPFALSLEMTDRGVASEPLDSFKVTVQDIEGKPVADFSGVIRLTFDKNPAGATLLGTLTAPAIAGIAHFDLVGIDTPGAGYTLVASTEGLPPATSSPIEIRAPRFTAISTGVTGGRIAGIAISAAPAGETLTLFAGASDGVYRSGDRGASWKRASFGGHTASHLVADPRRPGVVYSWNQLGLKRTIDGGGAWHDLFPAPVGSLALDPNDPAVIYIVGSELLRSTDGGTSWKALDAPSCDHIAVDAVVANLLYCAAYDLSTGRVVVFTSRDGGAWTATKGLVSFSFVQMMVATPTGVFVAGDGGVYRLSNPDDAWARVSSGFSDALAYAPSMPDRIYLARGSGVSVSNDGGASFRPATNAGDFIEALVVDPTDRDVVYAAGSRGVLVSTNGGVSWPPSSRGIDAHSISSVAMAPGAPDIVLAATERGTLRTTDGGASWSTVSQVNANVHFDPVVSTRAYQCGFFYFATSTDSGASFTGGNVSGLISSCSRLLVAGTTLFAAGSGRLLKSVDGGAQWAETGVDPSLYVFDAALGDDTGDVVVVATVRGIYRSQDGGASFALVTLGYTPGIVADPTMRTRIIAGQCPGIRISGDGGASFGSALGNVCASALIHAGSALYEVGSASDGAVLLTSTDGGSVWSPVDVTGIPAGGGVGVRSIAVSDDGKAVYFGTTAGLYKATGR